MIELQPKPKKLKTHSFKKSWLIPHTDKECWNILNKMETFTESQVFPYKVEFIDKKNKSDVTLIPKSTFSKSSNHSDLANSNKSTCMDKPPWTST